LPLIVPRLLGAERFAIGLTSDRTCIEGTSVSVASSAAPTLLLIGGLRGDDDSKRVVSRVVRDFEISKKRRPFRLLAIPLANPKGSRLVFPPEGVAYRDNAESHYLWRWIAAQAPDLVLIAGDDFGLAKALSENAVAGVGRIPALRVGSNAGILKSVPKVIPQSEAHLELDRRRSRTPRQLAEELAQYYGHDFDETVYIPAIALIGQLRLGHVAEVERLVAPYVDGSRSSLAKPASTNLAGHLIFAELASRTRDARYVQLVRKAADLGFDQAGEMKQSMPFHDEMSDSVFMACPILAAAGKLTGERKYFDMATRHLLFMQNLCLRPDGLYRHSPMSETAWGRGNAFPALGLALTLSDFPRDHSDYHAMLMAFQQHMAALARFQAQDGMWREVVDQACAYTEFSATAMIGTAMLRGIRNGWLARESYQPLVLKAWRAVSARVGRDGTLMDVCESTGKRKSLDDYLRRAAILGRDARGGAMALLFSTEMAGL
jgi:unsaturated rhamnogalacturonyl hydrolase